MSVAEFDLNDWKNQKLIDIPLICLQQALHVRDRMSGTIKDGQVTKQL